MNFFNISFALSIFLMFAVADFSYGQQIYLNGGVNISRLNQQKDNYNGQSFFRPGFHVGSAIEIDLNNNFYFTPGIQFSLKREKSEYHYFVPDFEDPTVSTTNTYRFENFLNEYYLEIPMTVKFRFIVDDINFYALAGPYINLRLFDTSTSGFFVNEEPTDIENTFDLENAIEEKFVNRLDYGMNAGLGIEMKSFTIQASYDYGFYRVMKYENLVYDQSLRNSVVRLTFGYKLKNFH